MPIAEPEGYLWSMVKPRSGWPETDEDAARRLAGGWQAGQAAFTAASEFNPAPLAAAWPDAAGEGYRTRIGEVLAEADGTASGMTELVGRATHLADAVTHAKTSIRTLLTTGQELYDTTSLLPLRIAIVHRLADEVNDVLARTAAQVAARSDLPGPLPHPPHDYGSGPFASDPFTIDQKLQELLYDELAAAAHPFAPDGAEHLAHYFDGTGTPMDVNPDDIIHDVPELGTAIEGQLDQQLREVAAQAATDNDYGRPIPFTSQWTQEPFNITPQHDRNWHLAIGNVHHSVTGVATVHPPITPGAAPQVEVTYQTHVYDRYNWDASDPGKIVELGGIGVPGTGDTTLAQFHRAGTAQEYDTVGSSAPRTETREIR
ncbi:hypothetical protein CFN78_08350 [Amycolatopsis antarctica]|uniref:Outer membrane channel protein CpnT-like N-terminal domain-containing protein n=1 Tax=Amycolatopsis antarctica TaxID=1854586 RepID=A0A263D4X5_9PSEU|nr:hypothetical protein [Amycolatopsis antarctica]OZM73542.1 hypothetical protein CFN78_08350 [Amycolatopsis antarctica]